MLPEQRVTEQAERLPVDGAVTGWAALRLAGGGFFDGLAPDGRTPMPVPLAVPRRHRARPAPEFALVRSAPGPGEVAELHGVRCTTPARAVFDEVRRLGDLREAVVAVDMALVARLLSWADLDAFLTGHAGSPGIGLLRKARLLATDRSRSPAETRMRLIWVLDAELPPPLCNWPIAEATGRPLGMPDLLSDELGVFGEFDGAGHRELAQHRIDVRREDGFRRAGLEGFAVVGADLHRRDLVAERMRAAVERAAASNRPRGWLLKVDPPPLWR